MAEKATKSGRVSGKSENKSNAPKGDTSAVDALLERDADAAPALSKDMLKRITTNALTLKARIARVAQLESDLEAAKKEVRDMAENVLPALMEEAQVNIVGLDDEEGTWIERGERVFASMSKENAPAACKWLDENGYGALIKTDVSIPLARGDRKTLERVQKALAKLKINPDVTESVHASTLLSFVKESIEAGRKLPPEIKVHQVPIVELKKPKLRKPRKKAASVLPSNEIDDKPF